MRIVWGVMILVMSGAVSCKKKVKFDPRLGDFSSVKLDSLVSRGPDLPDIYYDPDLYAFVPEYIKDAKDRGVEISERTIQALRIMRWVDKLSVGDGPGVMAACSRYYVTNSSFFGGSNRVLWTMIEVLRDKTLAYTKGNRFLLRELVDHELTHCLMELGHLPDGVGGIMSATFTEGDKRALDVVVWRKLLDDNFSAYFLKLMPKIGE